MEPTVKKDVWHIEEMQSGLLSQEMTADEARVMFGGSVRRSQAWEKIAVNKEPVSYSLMT